MEDGAGSDQPVASRELARGSLLDEAINAQIVERIRAYFRWQRLLRSAVEHMRTLGFDVHLSDFDWSPSGIYDAHLRLNEVIYERDEAKWRRKTALERRERDEAVRNTIRRWFAAISVAFFAVFLYGASKVIV
ncbi:hypothetical protein CBOM_05399 [Ceraceosorus bombacis]|uniref:Uncharacterized protein n=1 Tax=Ceraceosorus bombacis TaxID=401625 RepID=A0A0P1BQ25_9BASI|nr:hypothetical protein CBOM_05399 [Ceraceosorus bombacis]